MEEARCGAVFPGDASPVLMIRVDCSLFSCKKQALGISDTTSHPLLVQCARRGIVPLADHHAIPGGHEPGDHGQAAFERVDDYWPGPDLSGDGCCSSATVLWIGNGTE
jgi:hypothetical protein